MRHYPTALSADLPHQPKASPVIFVSEGTRGVTAKTSFPSRLTVGGEHRRHSDTVWFFCYHMVRIEVSRKAISRHVYVSVFAFIFQVKGQRCHICPSYEVERLGSSTSSQLSDIFRRHVDTNAAISTSTMLPSQHTTLGKQWAGWQGKPPCDQMFRKENL